MDCENSCKKTTVKTTVKTAELRNSPGMKEEVRKSVRKQISIIEAAEPVNEWKRKPGRRIKKKSAAGKIRSCTGAGSEREGKS
ncbi:hypothetical protein DWX26_08830 [Blautia sp. AF19-1]|nr:hypothetical protein DWX26_08830 [Blautia sp. AF19-1]